MNKNWSWVYNPFQKIAGWKAFAIGMVILTFATVIGYFGNTVFYGISIKSVLSITWYKAFSLQATGLAAIVIVMWITAILFAKHVRFQDILGTVTLAKYPLVLAAILFLVLSNWLNDFNNAMLSSANVQELLEIFNKLSFADYVIIILLVMVSFLILIWTITLLFNAFRVSTNLKGSKCALLFIAIMLISEIIIHILITVMS